MKNALIIFFLIYSYSGFTQLSQKQLVQIDSLKEVIAQSNHDTVSINAYVAWDEIIYISDPSLDFELNQKIESLCSKILQKKLSTREKKIFQKELAIANNNIGLYYRNNGQHTKALHHHKIGLEIAKKIGDKKNEANFSGNIGNIYKDQGNYDNALKYYIYNLKVYEKLNDKPGMASPLNNIGALYQLQKDTVNALIYYNRCLDIAKEANLLNISAISYNNIGIIFEGKHQFEQAMDNYNQSLNIFTKMGYEVGIAATLNRIGAIYFNKNNNVKAMEYFSRSLSLSEKIGNKENIAVSLINISKALLNRSNYKGVITYSTRALEIAEKGGLIFQKNNAAKKLHMAYEAIGKYKKALEMYEIFVATRDSMNSEENQKEIIRLKYRYEYEKKATTDSIKASRNQRIINAELATEKATNHQRKQQTYFLIGGLFIALLFGAIIFKRFRVTQNQKENLEIAQKKLTLSLEKEKELNELKSRFVSIASHQFRTPLTIIQSNMAILDIQKEKMDDTFKPRFEIVHKQIKGQVSRMTELLDDILIIGKINAGILKSELKPTDLVLLCKEIVKNHDEIQSDYRKMIFNMKGEPRKVRLDAKLMEHAISNLISNAFKYSAGKNNPEFTITFKDKRVEISVKDYGKGIPSEDIVHLFEPFYRASNVEEVSGTGLGTAIAKEYVELNNGIIKIKSELNQRSEFVIVLS